MALFASQAISKKLGAHYDEKLKEQQAIQYRKKVMQEKNWDKFSKEIFEQQNKVRVNPKVYIGYLEKCLGRFKGKILYSEDNKSFIETKEGPSAYTEAIEYLRT